MARRMKDVYPRAIGLVERKVIDLDEFVSHSFALADGAAAFEVASRREGLKTMIVVSP